MNLSASHPVNKIEHLNLWGETGSLQASVGVCALRVIRVYGLTVFLLTVYLFILSLTSHLGFQLQLFELWADLTDGEACGHTDIMSITSV